VVEVGASRVLLDCGFGIADTITRLARLGLAPEQLSGIVVTHEHEDHIGGVARLSRRFQLPVWLTHGTYKGLEHLLSNVPTIHFIDSYQTFQIDSIVVTPYPVPHDAREPAQFVFSDGVRRLGVLTDAGEPTRYMEQVLSGVNALVLECNHDREMLRAGHYSQRLKDRVGGRLGHLDNEAAAGLVSRLDLSRLQHLVAAHLSQHNNRPALARAALARAMNCDASWIIVADQEHGSPWLALS